ncbi:MAG: 30S ribosomal protein S12 methylthiotransferase RimO [Oscillospiraceae bacterium]|nr:30S ribosomal protein S12 methylthiotransferase RimO [Oscillospiraceae bacterium]
MNERIGFVSLGCPKNLVDGERMLAQLEEAGFRLVDHVADGADAVIINTCCFIDQAKQESIDTILEMAQLKEEGEIGKIIVVGCMAQKYRDEILAELPEADIVAGLWAAGDIAAVVRCALEGQTDSLYADDGNEEDDEKPQDTAPEALPLTGKRLLASPPHWAYLKIADGCSNNCAYCSIPSIRGAFRSVPVEDILAEAKSLVNAGVSELILIAQDTTAYGIDLYGELKLPALLRELCAIEGLRWIRLLYCYPDKITDELLDTMASDQKILPYIDMPLQHISDSILTTMNRRGTSAQIRETLARVREKLPEAAIRTTFITGLPGETQEDFALLHDFIKEQKFERLGVFTYSPQEGTPAAEMENQVLQEIAAQRMDILMRCQNDIVRANGAGKIGKTLEVICEDYDGYADVNIGRTVYDAPEIDALVYFSGDAAEGKYCRVKIAGVGEDGYDLLGSIQ